MWFSSAIVILCLQVVTAVDIYFIGCYEDNINRKLHTHMGKVRDVNQCVKKCQAFPYAGLQNGNECFCGSNIGIPINIQRCNMKCKKGVEICGGIWANSVYSTGIYSYVGCFTDTEDGSLSKRMQGVYNVKKCVESCRNANLPYAGIKNGKHCFCGNGYTLSPDCPTNCKISQKTCGGKFSISVYKTYISKPDPNQYYMGCFKDDKDRKLATPKSNVYSVSECVDICRKSGFLYAGVQFGKQCFCGNQYNRSPQVNSCMMECKIGTYMCGGLWANSIYATVAGNEFEDQYYIGCFKDEKDRKLPKFLGSVYNVMDCIKKCRQAGYPYAGAQNGNQCFCGRQYDQSPQVTNCNKKCSNKVDICGGFWANSIYDTLAPDEDKYQYYLGCFKDESIRKLPKSMGHVGSVIECVKKCRQAGFAYAGAQYGKHCFCGNKYKVSARVTNCDMMCKNGVDICGGVWANSIYNTDKEFDTPWNQLQDQYYIGCFKDEKDRKLPKFLGSVSNVMDCIKKCRKERYHYAGAQHGNQCFCGHRYDQSPQVTNCDMKCSNKVDICGGFWANSIYSIGVPNENNDQHYMGCYKDDKNRKLPKSMGHVGSVIECVKKCRQAGFAYAGAQYGQQCFCGNKYKVSARVTNCDMMCKNGVDICGGFWANSIYHTVGNQLSDQYFIGCFKDEKDRKLPKFLGSVSNVMDCIKKCRKEGYHYAGAQHGNQCFCGHQYDQSPRVTNCDMKCSNKVDICGGFWANSIYSIGVPDENNDQHYMGCYKDDKNRKLPKSMGLVGSVIECVKKCRQAGFAYAGAQYGKHCFCGNKYKVSAQVTNCDMMCKNGMDICGGSWANSIYHTVGNQLSDQYYIGCFKDEQVRKLPKFLGSVSNVMDCIKKCRKEGYHYAGAQHGNQCFCGHRYDQSPRVTNCDMKCSNKVDICGGFWANSIYSIGFLDENNGVPDENNDQHYMGCYKDDKNRKLPKSMGLVGSVIECVKKCRQAGYAYAGAQYGKHCFCGNKYKVSAQVTTCDMMCKNGMDICGGSWANSIYHTVGNQLSDQYYIGCFKDEQDRKLPKFFGSVSNVMDCIKKCRKEGYHYAGAQHGNQCFCGHQYDQSPRVTNCDMKCSNKVDICGGFWANSIYSIGVPDENNDQHYMGCYKDDKNRKLPKSIGLVGSVIECVKKCRQAGYAYAGAQYGKHCFCGNKYKVSAQVTNCDMMCKNGMDICGGSWANAIYHTVGNQLSDQYYIGCFKDEKDRKLPKFLGSVSNVMDCIKKCRKEGYHYAGAQHGNQCFCGHRYDQSPRVTNCDMKCSNKVDICGGFWANSIYSIGVLDENNDQHYMGCYKDDKNRKLPKSMGLVGSVIECVKKCRQGGFAYAGAQYGKHCFCGHKYKVSAQVTNCDMMCKNGMDICGGFWANSIYHTVGNQLSDQYFIGCFKDEKDRKLPKFLGSVSNVMDCINKCRKEGYHYAGAQHGNQCFCGHRYDQSPRVTNCDMKCSNKVDICGGFWANSIYSIGVPDENNDQHYMGCYKDDKNRKLPKSMGLVGSVIECVKKCRQGGYAYAGVQYGKHCFCGNKYKVSAQVTNCDMMCKNGMDICGGSWANSIYHTVGNQLSDQYYIGCFKDEKDRKLPKFLGSVSNVMDCIKKCRKEGYHYAGAQHGNQCFCGHRYDQSPRVTNCDMKCSNKVDICGGFWANSIYSIGVPDENNGVPGENNDQHYMGCYKDDKNRKLPKSMGLVGSVIECVKKCREAGFAYAGAQYGKQCFCGNKYKVSPRVTNCDMMCKNGVDICGGFWANSIYHTDGNQLLDQYYIGCFKDEKDRKLPTFLGSVSNVMDCINKCRKEGYHYAGAQYGNQCFCGHRYDQSPRVTNCDMKCSNKVDICGGFWANSIYRIVSPDKDDAQYYLGCYKDNQHRKLPKSMGHVNSIKDCVHECRQAGYAYAGVQYGKQCFCGNKYKVSARVTNCDMMCKNGVDICGGFWANAIYGVKP